MQTNEVAPGALERRIDMSISVQDVEKEVEARLKRLARTVKMAGFRPGKVPMKIVSQTYGPQVRSEAIGAAVERAFGEAIREQNLRVAGYPRIEPKQGRSVEEIEFSAIFEVYPEVKIGDLASEEIERPILDVGEAEVERTIEVLRKQRTIYSAVTRASEDGDRVVIDFIGRKDGEVFDGGSAQDYSVIVGAGTMLPEFDTQLKGVVAGDGRVFDLTFPSDYHAQHLAGQVVQFEMHVKAVEAPQLPDVDEGFARALGVADGDVAKMREEVRSNLEREVRRRISARLKQQVMDVLVKATPLVIPRALVEEESRQLADNARQDLLARGMSADKISVETSWFSEQAAKRVHLGLVLAELVRQHNLEAKPEQVRASLDDFAQSYEDPSEVVQWYLAQPQRLKQVESLVVEDNVVEWVLSQTRTIDKAIAFEDLMGDAPIS